MNSSGMWKNPAKWINCNTQQYLCLRLLMQAIRVKLNVEVAIIPYESKPNYL